MEVFVKNKFIGKVTSVAIKLDGVGSVDNRPSTD